MLHELNTMASKLASLDNLKDNVFDFWGILWLRDIFYSKEKIALGPHIRIGLAIIVGILAIQLFKKKPLERVRERECQKLFLVFFPPNKLYPQE